MNTVCNNCKYYTTCGDPDRVAACNGKEVGIPEVINFSDIVTIAKAHMKPEDIDHHESDLYLKVNEISRQIVNASAQNIAHVDSFISNIEPHVPWFDIWWAYHE